MTVQQTDFKSLRQWDGSQHRAFEELCYQLRDRSLDGFDLVKTGDPDGGLEWYVTQSDGSLWGWQAKYTFDVDNALKLMERSLKTVIRTRPNCRKLTFCIPFDLPDAPSKGARKSARQKFEDRKASWKQRIPDADRVRIELWSEGRLLEKLVSHPCQRGIALFFWNREVFSSDWCSKHVETTLAAASGRYSLKLHIDVPTEFALEGLARSETYWGKYRRLRKAVIDAADWIEVQRFTGLGVTQKLICLSRCVEKWKRNVPVHVNLPVRLDRNRFLDLSRELLMAVDKAFPKDTPRRKRRATQLQSRNDEQKSFLQNCLNRLHCAIDAFETFLLTEASMAAQHGALMLTGKAGQGKTHLFCDVAKRTTAAHRPAIVLLASRMSARRVWQGIANQLGLGSITREEVIGAMQAAAEASNTLFLLLIDALNEVDDPKAWQEELPALLAEIAKNPWISLGVSVRSTYQSIVLPDNGLTDLPKVEHQGFVRCELEAIERFFDAYGLDQPQIPFHTHEFTNPLFLKLYCEGLHGFNLRAPSLEVNHVSGVFERYLASKTRRIASHLELDPETRTVEEAIDAFCRELARHNKDSLEYNESAKIINAIKPNRDRWPNTLFGKLLDEDILTADNILLNDTDKSVQVVRFTYQGFADYRVGSAFLGQWDDDPAKLREAMSADRQLRNKVMTAPAGWIEALSVLVPEKFGIELLDTANWQLDSSTHCQWESAFVRSVYERQATTVTKRTRKLLLHMLHNSAQIHKNILDTLVSVAPIPDHPLNDMLHRILKRLAMPDRDVVWSIPTYYTIEHGGPLDFLIRWAARGPYPNCPAEVVEKAAIPIVWTFTSPNRRMRDYATKALVHLLSESLEVLPPLISRFDDVNDPYVIERLAVVSHGALLCGGRKAKRDAVDVARNLKRVAFGKTQIPNIITRDAVRGVHEWCMNHNLIDKHEYTETLPPYGTDPAAEGRTEKQLDCVYGSRNFTWPYSDVFVSIFVNGDFGRHVIGSTMSYFTKVPLSNPIVPEQDQVEMYPVESAKSWVFERVLSLGWTPERFEDFDKDHVPHRIDRSEHKAERFGKKYQWIAFRELVARVADNFHMADDYGKQRRYEGPWQFYGRDIDPTLPPPQLLRNVHGERELRSTFVPDDEAWWIPPRPSYGPNDPPVSEDWAIEQENVPEFKQMVKRKDKAGTCWIVLHARHHWDENTPEDEERKSYHLRKFRGYIFSWLVQTGDRSALVTHLNQRSLMGRWMPERDKFSDAAYLGELPWALATAKGKPDPEEKIETHDGTRSRVVDVWTGWAEYLWEGKILDCSIEDDVTASIPNPILFKAGELEWIPGTRTWREPDGVPTAQYRSRDGHCALLVRENWLKKMLKKLGYSMVFGWSGDKRLLETGVID